MRISKLKFFFVWGGMAFFYLMFVGCIIFELWKLAIIIVTAFATGTSMAIFDIPGLIKWSWEKTKIPKEDD